MDEKKNDASVSQKKSIAQTRGLGIRAKIAALVGAGFALTFLSILTMDFFGARDTADEIGSDNNQIVARLLADQMGAAVRFHDSDRISAIYAGTAEDLSASLAGLRVYHIDGTILSDHEGTAMVPIDKDELSRAFDEVVASGKPWSGRSESHHVVAVPIKTADGKTLVGVLSTAWSHDAIVELLTAGTLHTMMLAGGVTVLGLAAIMFLVSRQVTQPVQALSAAMARISERDFETDVQYSHRRDEIGQMSVKLREFRDDLAIEAKERQVRVAKDQHVMALFDELCECLSRAAKGDIDVRIDTAAFNDLSPQYLTVCANFNGLVESLSGMLETINLAAETVRVNSLEISQVATDQSQRSEAQAATLEESAAGLKQLTHSVRSTAEHAARANQEIQANRTQAEESGTVVARTVDAMKKIEASSNQITEIITVIDDIAFQTNLLALNAGVEAARAGEAGRGFAVVASEVRALAQRASDSANEIKELIVNSGQHVQEGGTLVDQTGQALNNIIEGVAKVSDIVSSIATASRDQSDNLEEINQAVNELDKVTQQNAAIIEETSAASSALSQEAERLTDALARFRSGETLDTNSSEQLDDNVQVLFRAKARNGGSEHPTQAVANGEDQDGWHDF